MKLLLSLFTVFFSLSLSAQESDNWEFLQEKDGLVILKQVTQCHIPSEGIYQELVLLKFENKNNYPIEITWFTDTYRDNECVNCDHSKRDTKRVYELGSKDTITGDCLPGLNIGLEVFSKWLDLPNNTYLTKMEVTGVAIKPIKL